jgi:UDP:flavonoid glycosyltransferase YjiC (YdhE family)
VVLAADGTLGDVFFPMLALAKALKERGHDVLLCASPDNAQVAAARGVPFRAVGVDVRAYRS